MSRPRVVFRFLAYIIGILIYLLEHDIGDRSKLYLLLLFLIFSHFYVGSMCLMRLLHRSKLYQSNIIIRHKKNCEGRESSQWFQLELVQLTGSMHV